MMDNGHDKVYHMNISCIYCRCLLVEVLLHRAGAKQLILNVIKDMIRPGTAHSLATIGEVFNRVNQVGSFINQ